MFWNIMAMQRDAGKDFGEHHGTPMISLRNSSYVKLPVKYF